MRRRASAEKAPSVRRVWEAESVRVREAFPCTLDVRYGAGPNMTADLFPAPAAGAPIQVFIHGGYWRAMDKDVHSFPAEGFAAAGGAAVSINYALAPAVNRPMPPRNWKTGLPKRCGSGRARPGGPFGRRTPRGAP